MNDVEGDILANSPTGESMVERLLRVLEAFDARHSELTIAALARRAELPRATAYRIVADFAEHGVVEKLPNGKVRIGMRMWELSYRSLSSRRLREIAMPYMHEVQRQVGQHTNLAIINDGEVLYVERLSSPQATRNVALIASRLPRHACSSGLVLMAHAAPAEREAFLAEAHPRYTPQTVTEPQELRKVLAGIRTHGYFIARGLVITESDGIAVPVFGEGGEAIAALNVIVPAGYRDVESAIVVLKDAARRITEAMQLGRPSGAARR